MKKQKLQLFSGAFCAPFLCVFGAACVRAQPPNPPVFPSVKPQKPMKTDPTASPAVLRGTLSADKKQIKPGETITFTYSITNQSKTEQTLRFSSGQRFDLVITQDGKTVWQMSREKMYTMSLGSVAFAPGETKTFTSAWKPTDETAKPGGVLKAEAFLTPMGSPRESRPASANLSFEPASKSVNPTKAVKPTP